MSKNKMMDCPKCGKQLPVSRKGKLPRHYEERRPAFVCDMSNKTVETNEPKVSPTLEHRSGWYIHPDTKGQQRRMMTNAG